jgi:sulfate transport system ATP-binding protein
MEEGAPVHVVIRSYDIKFWREDDGGVGVVRRLIPFGDRVRVEATVGGSIPITAYFPRRSSLLTGLEPGAPIAVEVTKARVYPKA